VFEEDALVEVEAPPTLSDYRGRICLKFIDEASRELAASLFSCSDT
jgi:hypothetical protein